MNLDDKVLETDYYNPMERIWEAKNDNDHLNKKAEEFANTIIPNGDKDDH